jgi:16S rRNA (guanine527-N7)-methyltransferase
VTPADESRPSAAPPPPSTSEPTSDPLGVPPASATGVFGERLTLAVRYAEILATDGVVRGLIGPREVSRLWDRHLLNSAVAADLVPAGARVVDVGSGAGLPGLPMALRRPDLSVDLVEPMQRRTDFLTEVVSELGLGSAVRVVRGRADSPEVIKTVGAADWVVARAVAPLDRLVRWCLPLLAPGGRLLALKGARAADEVDQHRSLIGRLGGGEIEVLRVGEAWPEAATWVVSLQRVSATRRARARRARA